MILLELLEEGVIGAFIGDKKNSHLPECRETRGLIDQSKRIDKQEAETIRQILKGNKGLQRFFNKNHERSFGRWDIRPDAESENLPDIRAPAGVDRRYDASLLLDMSLFAGDIGDFLSEWPEARLNISQDPSGVFMVNRIKVIADSASRLSPKAKEALLQQTIRWAAATAEIASRYDMWHEIDQQGYRQFTSEGVQLLREAVDKVLAELTLP